MKNKNFLKRLYEFGFKKIILSLDTFIGIIVFFIIYILTKGIINEITGKEILSIFIQISSSWKSVV